MTVKSVSEADSSSVCPECGSVDMSRDGDTFRCHDCELAAHSDVVGVRSPADGLALLPRLLNVAGTYRITQRV